MNPSIVPPATKSAGRAGPRLAVRVLAYSVAGALLVGLRVAMAPALEATQRPELVVSAEALGVALAAHERTLGEPATAAERQAILDHLVDEEILFREAIALGMDRGDETVFWRLLEKMEYLGERRADDSDEAVFRRALDLGLQRDDPFVRAALVRKYGEMVRYTSDLDPVTDAEAVEYYERNKERFRARRRVAVSQVFFSRDRRGDDGARASAHATYERLESTSSAAPPAAQRLAFERALEDGDAFVVGPELPLRSAASLARTFGEDFARRVVELPPDRWSEPIASPFGYHLVRIRESEQEEGGYQPMADVHNQVTMSRKHERRDAALEAALVDLRGRYEIRVETRGAASAARGSTGDDAARGAEAGETAPQS